MVPPNILFIHLIYDMRVAFIGETRK